MVSKHIKLYYVSEYIHLVIILRCPIFLTCWFVYIWWSYWMGLCLGCFLCSFLRYLFRWMQQMLIWTVHTFSDCERLSYFKRKICYINYEELIKGKGIILHWMEFLKENLSFQAFKLKINNHYQLRVNSDTLGDGIHTYLCTFSVSWGGFCGIIVLILTTVILSQPTMRLWVWTPSCGCTRLQS